MKHTQNITYTLIALFAALLNPSISQAGFISSGYGEFLDDHAFRLTISGEESHSSSQHLFDNGSFWDVDALVIEESSDTLSVSGTSKHVSTLHHGLANSFYSFNYFIDANDYGVGSFRLDKSVTLLHDDHLVHDGPDHDESDDHYDHFDSYIEFSISASNKITEFSFRIDGLHNADSIGFVTPLPIPSTAWLLLITLPLLSRFKRKS